jgi:putative ABC transport system permease protein
MSGLALAFRLARRDLRGGVRGFRIVLACLALGVAAIAAIGSLSRAVEEGLRADARILLGGDARAEIVHRPISGAERAWLEARGTVSASAEMRAMAAAAKEGNGDAGAAAQRILVEFKAVDRRYPLYGALVIDGRALDAAAVSAALAPRDGVPGAFADALLLARLGLKVGDRIRIGAVTVDVRGTIDREPDRATRIFTLGPRLMVDEETLAASGLVQPGSLIYYQYRVRLPQGGDGKVLAAAARAAFPEAGWRLRAVDEAAPGLGQFIDRLTLYLTLVGLTALLIGGLGIASGVKAWLDGRTGTIATMKCLGAPAGLVFRVYLIEILALASAAIAAGAILGAVLPMLFAGALESVLPVRLRTGFYALPLIQAASFGFLTTLVFSVAALGSARDVPPAVLFRSTVAPVEVRPRTVYILATALIGLALALLAIGTATDKRMATLFVVGVLGAFFLFRLFAGAIARAAALAGRRGGLKPTLRFALANLHRPGAPIGRIVLALGLGATMLVAVALIQGNLARQLAEQIPARSPTFFFIDILPHQVEAFDKAVASVPGATGLERVAMLRGRISRLNGVPVAEAKVAAEARWAIDNERGLTYAATPPKNAEIVAGKWWPADYAGPPIVSFDAALAAGMGLTVGDTITVNILGREVTATIANLRRIQWRDFRLNFTVIFAPGAVERAPHSHIATVSVPKDGETALVNAVASVLPNVSAIHVRDSLESATRIFDQIALAVRLTALVTVLAGLLVLAGAVAAGHKRRVYDAVVFKVLGATRRRVLGAFLLEYGLIGLATAALAALLGAAIAWGIVSGVMRAEWTLLPATAIGTALSAAVIALAFGFVGTWRAMGAKAAPLLRNE